MKRRVFLLGAFSLAGCASQKLLPDDYAGETAVIKDSHVRRKEKSWLGGEYNGIEIFAVSSVDGKYLTNASHVIEGGYSTPVTTKGFERRIPTRPIKVRLERYYVIRTETESPSDLGNKTVTFTPVAGETYVVRGESVGSNYNFNLWIETEGGKRVS
jgi:hypothetical protein